MYSYKVDVGCGETFPIWRQGLGGDRLEGGCPSYSFQIWLGSTQLWRIKGLVIKCAARIQIFSLTILLSKARERQCVSRVLVR